MALFFGYEAFLIDDLEKTSKKLKESSKVFENQININKSRGKKNKQDLEKLKNHSEDQDKKIAATKQALNDLEITNRFLFRFYYKNPVSGWRAPVNVSSNYPPSFACLPGLINEKTKITLVSHFFDMDQALRNLKIKYALTIILSDSSRITKDIQEVELNN